MISRRGKHFLFLAGTLVCFTEPAIAGGLRNMEDSWLLCPATARELLTGRPHCLDRRANFSGWMGQGRLFSMPELEQRVLGLSGVAYPWGKRVSWSGSWQQTGSGLFEESRVASRFLVGHNPALGFAFHRNRLTLAQAGQEPEFHSFLLLEAPLKWRDVGGWVQIKWPVFSTVRSGGRALLGRRTQLLKIILARSGHAWALVADRLPNGTPQFGCQIFMTLAMGVALEFRFDAPTGSLGPGLCVVRGGVMIRTSHVAHPKLGVTHRLVVVWGRFGLNP